MPGTEAILVLVCQPRASLYYATLAAEDRLTLARMPRRVLVDASFASFAPSGLKAEDAPSQSEIRSGCHIPHGFQGVQNLVTLQGDTVATTFHTLDQIQGPYEPHDT